MNNKDIRKFNKYCADVIGYGTTELATADTEYDPYYNLYQLAAVVEKLIELTGKHPADLGANTDNGTWRIWSNYVIDAMDKEESVVGTLDSKLRLELATYEDGMVSKTEYINQTIKVIKSHEKPCEATLTEKITKVLVDSGYSFATSKLGVSEKLNVDPFYGGSDETLELWGRRQSAALEGYFEQRPRLWELWGSYDMYSYDTGMSRNEWRQDRIKWCIEQMDEIL